MATQAQNTKDWWDSRYSSASGFLFSKQPSDFLMAHLDLIPNGGKILVIACGEGRNAVALALKKFNVVAIDYSKVAIERAQALAAESGVKVEWKSSDLDFFIPELLAFDAIVCIHFKPQLTLLKNLTRGLKQGGHLIMEAHLLEAMKTQKSLETFECYKPNELLSTLNPQGMQLQVLYYSELGPAKSCDKVQMIAKKTQLF